MTDSQTTKDLKICIVGDTGIGKTCLIQRLLKDVYLQDCKAVGYVETSAKTGEGVHKAIQMGIKAVLMDDGPYDLISRGVYDELYDELYDNKRSLNVAIARGQHDEVSNILEKIPSLEEKGGRQS